MRRALGTGWWFGLGHFTIGLNWIATAFYYQNAMPHWLGWCAVVALSLYLAVYPAAAVGLAWRYGRGDRIAFSLWLAAAWIVTEYLRASLFTGFAWNPLGVTLVDIAQLTRWIGTYGLSAIVILGAGAVTALGFGRWRQASVLAAPLLGTALLALLLPSTPAAGPNAPQIHVVQPDINQNEKQSEALAERNYNRLVALTGKPASRTRLILWPEAAIPDYLEEEAWARYRLAGLLGPNDILLTGGDTLIYDKTGALAAARNSLFALDARAAILGRYDKAHLVPYGEYLPMRPFLTALGLSRLVPGEGDILPGPGPRTLDLPGFGRVGAQICYEIVFSGEVVDRANRPDFLVNPSNDAWFGAFGPPQHFAQARLRALEEGLPVIRSTPTGITGVIDAQGRIVARLPMHEEGVIDTRVPEAAAATPFALLGNLLPLAFALLLVAGAIAVRRKTR